MNKRTLPLWPKLYLYLNGIYGVVGIVIVLVLFCLPWTKVALDEGVEEGEDFGYPITKIDGILLDKYPTEYTSIYGRVYAYEFTTLDKKETRKWVSYGDLYKGSVGSKVKIEVSSNDPSLYRIEHLASALLALYQGHIILFFLLALGFVWGMIAKGSWLYELVIQGGYTDGVIYKVKKASLHSDGDKEFDVYIEYYNLKNILKRIVVHTDDLEGYKKGATKALFYHVKNKNENILVERLPIVTRDYVIKEWNDKKMRSFDTENKVN